MWRPVAALTVALAFAWAQNPPPPAQPPKEVPKAKAVDKQLTAIERQRLSVERQLQSIRENYPPPFGGNPAPIVAGPPAAPAAECPPVTAAEVKPIIDREALKHNMDARLVQAVVEAESAYSPCAVSHVGALGLMQLMPATAESLQVTDPFDPNQNITAGAQYLKNMLERYGGDVAKALAAYNAGPARVDAAGGIPQIPETQEYVRKIMGKISPVRPVE